MENKQTAMQEMYSDLIQKHMVYTKSGMINEATSLVSSIELAEHLIGKEKEQIINARIDGDEHHTFNSMMRESYANDYYNETYANDTTKGLPEEDSKRRAWHY